MNCTLVILLAVLILQARSAVVGGEPVDTMMTLHALPVELLVLICCMGPRIIPSLSLVNKAMYAILTVHMAPDQVYTSWMEYRFEGRKGELAALQMYNISPYIQGHPIFKDLKASSNGLALSSLTPQDEFDKYVTDMMASTLDVNPDSDSDSEGGGDRFLDFLLRNTHQLSLFIRNPKLAKHQFNNPPVLTTIAIVLVLSRQREALQSLRNLNLRPKITRHLTNNYPLDNQWSIFYACGVAACISMSDSFGFEHYQLLKDCEMVAFLLGRGYVGRESCSDACGYRKACLRVYNTEPHSALTSKDIEMMIKAEEWWEVNVPEELLIKVLLLHKIPNVEIKAMRQCGLHVIRALLRGDVPFNVVTTRRRHRLLNHHKLQARMVALLDEPSLESNNSESIIFDMRGLHRLHPFTEQFVAEAYSYFNDAEMEVLVRVVRNLKAIFGEDWDKVILFYKNTNLYEFLQWADTSD